MFSKFFLVRVMLLLVLVFLIINIALEIPTLANGAGGQPFPPDQSPLPGGGAGTSSFVVTLLTILQLVL